MRERGKGFLDFLCWVLSVPAFQTIHWFSESCFSLRSFPGQSGRFCPSQCHLPLSFSGAFILYSVYFGQCNCKILNHFHPTLSAILFGKNQLFRVFYLMILRWNNVYPFRGFRFPLISLSNILQFSMHSFHKSCQNYFPKFHTNFIYATIKF